MTSGRKRSHLVVLGVCLALAQAVGAADKKPQTIKDLQSRPVEVRKDNKVSATSSKAMENYRRFLELQKTDPAAARRSVAPSR